MRRYCNRPIEPVVSSLFAYYQHGVLINFVILCPAHCMQKGDDTYVEERTFGTVITPAAFIARRIFDPAPAAAAGDDAAGAPSTCALVVDSIHRPQGGVQINK